MVMDNQIPEDIESEIDFKAIRKRFLDLNQARLDRARSALTERQQEVLKLIPLLFHVNHPLLPGFASKHTPSGVWGYEPEQSILNRAKVLAKSFVYQKPAKKQYPVLALYFMGSSGTIAHAEDSDFDFWLCHDPELGRDDLAELQKKANGIEKWADSVGLEVHFFLVNSDDMREGKQGDLSSESSGSAQHNLLLDEFYRSSVLLAGKYPLWWMVPPEYEASYDIYVSELQRKRIVYIRDTIDFGGLVHIPAGEFFGAALWQLSKGIDSPYKSILKLLLIESYASEYPAVELMSKFFKQSIYDGKGNIDELDPYILMLNKVSDYLQGDEEQQRLDIARRCFYFKVDIRLSDRIGPGLPELRRERLRELVEQWNWSRGELMLMDARSGWKVNKVLEERQVLFAALVNSYRFLSDFARKYSGLSMISQQDLTTLGRKLYTAFERKAGKVDIVTRGIDADLHERQLTFVEMRNREGETGWNAYSGVISQPDVQKNTPIKRAHSLTEIISWCYFNRVMRENTTIMVHSNHSRHSTKDVESIVQRVRSDFPLAILKSHDVMEFGRAARLLKAEFFINTGVRTSDSGIMNKNIAATGHTDPFYYGHSGGNQIQALDQLSVNSWREAMVHRFKGRDAVMEALCDYLKWYPPSAAEVPPIPRFYGGNSSLGHSIAHRVEGLFREVVELFYGGESSVGKRFIVTMGRSHFVFFFVGDKPRYERLVGDSGLIQFLGKPRERFISAHFDSRFQKESFLPMIYDRNKPGQVQLFFYEKKSMADIYVLDEKGALFHQRLPYHDETTLLGQFSRFFEAVSNRINLLLQDGPVQGAISGVEFYRLSSDAIGRRRIKSVAPQFYQSGKSYFSLQVLVEQDGKGGSNFSLYCDDQEFTTLEHGNAVFNVVVAHVLKQRRSGQSYPIYITDISLDRSVVGEENVNKMQSIHFLNYKRRIEERLNSSMRKG